MVGMFAADIWVSLRKLAPPGTNTSAWLGRSAPPDSVRLTSGSRLRSAMSIARRALCIVIGLCAPPLTVGSFALTRHSTPLTQPMPVTSPTPSSSLEPQPASGESSRNGLSASSRAAIRSRGSSLPRSRCRATALAAFSGFDEPPPATTVALSVSISAKATVIASRLARNVSERGSTDVRITGFTKLDVSVKLTPASSSRLPAVGLPAGRSADPPGDPGEPPPRASGGPPTLPIGRTRQ